MATRGGKFEAKVRDYASVRFGVPFRSEHLVGIDFDCVSKLREDYFIIVEATVDFRMEKVRGDIARLQIVKQKLIGEGVFADIYLVLDREPTDYMSEGGRDAKVKVVSFENFYRAWFDSTAYIAARAIRPFGSAFREGSSGPDDRPYVTVLFDDRDGKRYDIERIGRLIKNGERLVLTGEFGTGKSRAIQQLFEELTPSQATERSPLSIDLRLMWGTTSAEELVRRHFSQLQMGKRSQTALDALHHDEFFLLLDGFDELAIQEWSSEPGAISRSRARTMEPVRDILNRTKNGGLLTGRSHYFSSDAEMLDALGLSRDTTILSTPPEFTNEEVDVFLRSSGNVQDIPPWLPKKPLIVEMFAEADIAGLLSAELSRPMFWEMFMDGLCKRDAKIRESYDPETIKQILCRLSRKARASEDGRGPISPSDVQAAFTDVVGQVPAQEAASMLQRLPGLGRVAAETDDRQFVDDFIVNGLRGLDVTNIVSEFEDIKDVYLWRHGAGELGLEVIANRIDRSFTIPDAIRRIQSERGENNGVLGCDVVGGLFYSDAENFDLTGSELDGGYISVLDMSNKEVTGLRISSCEIGVLIIFNSNILSSRITHSTIDFIDGVAGEELPDWISDCIIGERSNLDTVSRIRRTGLLPGQMILVTVLRKTFLQPGSGRKEEALMRGLGDYGDLKLQNRVLGILINNSFLSEAPGKSGRLYIPQRSKTARVKKMVSQLQQSDDDVWREVSKLS